MQFPEGKNWHTLNSLLDELLDLDVDARQQRLAALARERPDLIEPLTRLLKGTGDSDTLDAVLGEALHFLSDREALPEQRRLGPWKVLSELGRGGMAQVLLAERADGAFEQKAALKLLWPGMADANVLARFEQERQILAALDDPRIAHLIDGGVTDDGRPWLAMEYVEGLPVDEYCDQQRLGIDQRLELFCQIAAAVSAAHRRLVVHRDIKPANVMVTDDAQVKLLDFGIAKLLDDDALPNAVPATRRADRLLTPEYASPEQLTESPITTASDVYQLGALLFQLLTGEPPHRRKGLSTAEFEARILAQEPPRPSTRVRALDGETAETVVGGRGLTRKSLIRRLRGDLDAIVAQAMATDPESRYESADALRQDVQRTLRALPVHARPARTLYQTGKFLRRHWMGASATVLIGLAVLAGLTGTVWQARIAAAEARKTGEVKNFLIGLFEVSDPDTARGREISARELLDEGAARIRDELAGEPKIQAELLNTLGGIYLRLGHYARAEPLLEQALSLRQESFGPDSRETAESLHALGRLSIRQGELESAEANLNAALTVYRKTLGPEHPVVANVLDDMIEVMRFQRRYAEAEPLADKVLVIRRAAYAEDDPRIADALMTAAIAAHNQGEMDRAEVLYRQALEIRQAHHGEVHSRVGSALHNLGFIAMERERWDEAVELFERVEDINRQIFGDVYTEEQVRVIGALGRALEGRGDAAGAEAAYREAIGILRQLDHEPALSGALHTLGLLLQRQGRTNEAEPLIAESLELRRRAFGTDHAATLRTQIALGRTRRALGEYDAARDLVHDAAERARSSLDDDHPVHTELREALEELGEQDRLP